MPSPRGCKADLEELLRAHGVGLDLVDERVAGAPLDLRFQGKLTAVQASAVRAFVAPPGVGKTVIGTYLVAARACSTLILVHRKPLLDQWLAQLALFLGIDRKDVGQIAGTKRAPTGHVDVAMIQSLVRREAVADLVASYGQVIVDECHHLPAVQFERVPRRVPRARQYAQPSLRHGSRHLRIAEIVTEPFIHEPREGRQEPEAVEDSTSSMMLDVP